MAAAELSVELKRLALVPEPGPNWPQVVVVLLDGVDVVVVAPPAAAPTMLARRLAARARQRGTILIAATSAWPIADLTAPHPRKARRQPDDNRPRAPGSWAVPRRVDAHA